MPARICPRRASANTLLCLIVQESVEDGVSRGVPGHGRAKEAPTPPDRTQATVRPQSPIQLDATWMLGSPEPTSQGSPLRSPPLLWQQLYGQMLNPDNYSGPHNGPRPSRRPRAWPAASLRQQKPPLPLRPQARAPLRQEPRPPTSIWVQKVSCLEELPPRPPPRAEKSQKSKRTLRFLPPASLCVYGGHKPS